MRAGKESARERKFIVGKGGQRYDGRNSLSNLDLTVLVRFIRIPERAHPVVAAAIAARGLTLG